MPTNTFTETVHMSVIYFETHQQIQMDLWIEREMGIWVSMC